MKDRIKIFTILIFTLIIGFIIYYLSLGYIINLTNIKSVQPKITGNLTLTPYGPITKDQAINQTFIAQHKNLVSLQIDIGTYNSIKTGITCFNITNITTNTNFYNKCLSNSIFVNDSYYTINFKSQNNIKGNKISLKITSPTKSYNKAIAVFEYNTGNIIGYNLHINNIAQTKNLAIREVYNINGNNLISKISQISQRYPYKPIVKGNVLKQYFKATYTNLRSLKLATGNYSRVNNSLLCIKVHNLTKNNTFYNKCIVSTDFVNNTYYKIHFTIQKNIKNNEILMTIYSPNATIGNSITVFLYSSTNIGYNLYSNNQKLNANLDFIATYTTDNSFFKSFNTIYGGLYLTNPYILKGYYIYILLLIYPVALTILIFLLEIYLLKNKSVLNIIITNLIFLLIFIGIVYYMNNLQNLTIGCYAINFKCVGTTVPSSF